MMTAPRRISDVVSPALTRVAFLGVLVGAAACTRDIDEPTGPRRLTGKHPTAVVEITFENIGGPNMRSSALVAPSLAELEVLRAARAAKENGANLDLTVPQSSGGGGNGTIELSLVSQSAVNSGGFRYFQATYNVRNAQSNGTAFDTPRSNLTFLAVSTAGTLLDTPVSKLENSGGAVDATVARTLQPTGHVMTGGGGELIAVSPDVFQAFEESDVAAISAPAGVTNIFPYGFVTRLAGNNTTRTLPASPAGGQFDGAVTFAFRIPDSGPSTPSTIRVVMLAVDDSDTRLTQSLEEQNATDAANAIARAVSLNATKFNLLPKSDAFIGGGQENVICSIRTSGPAGAATSTLFAAPNGEPWLLPTPNQAGPYFLSRTARVAAARCPGIASSDKTAFAVHGSQTGRPLGANVAGAAIVHAAALGGNGYFPGEEVEVSATTGLGGTTSFVARYRVASAAASGTFGTPSSFAQGGAPSRIGVGDLNRDGNLDLVISNQGTGIVSVRYGNGNGTFGAATDINVGGQVATIALGDFNGDGYLDAAIALEVPDQMAVLLNNGSGALGAPTYYATGGVPTFVAAGDLNNDGRLDLVTANYSTDDISVFIGNGDGTFQPQQTYSVGDGPVAVAIGDVNNDGKMDLAVAENNGFGAILIGAGDGTFAAPTTLTTSAPTSNVAFGDIDGDGDLDVVFTEDQINCVSIFLNNGSGGFGAETLLSVSAEPWSIELVDLNGDGRLDLLTAGLQPEIGVALGNGNGTFGTITEIPVTGGSYHVVAADVNNDGRLDLVSPRFTTNEMLVLLAQP